MEAIQRSLPPNPKESANIFSELLFIWTAAIFKRGYKKVLDVADLFQPLKCDRSESLGDRLEKQWLHQQKTTKKPSLIRAMFKTFWKEITFMGALAVINELGIRLAQPIVLGQLLLFFRLDNDKDEKSKAEALYYGTGVVLLTAIASLTFNHFTMTAFHNGMKLRVAVCSIIYRKALRLSRTALGDTAPGKVVNLLSNDVSRFDIVSIFVHSMWTAPLVTLIVGVLLWTEIQWAGLVGILVVFIVVPLQSYTGKLSSKFRYQTAIRTDERVRFMDEIIMGVQVIKMYAWEIPFSKLISLSRKFELKIVRKNSHVRALYMTFNLFTTRAALFCTMLALALSDSEITASKVFVVMSYFNVIAWTMSQMFVRGVAELAEALVAFRRLQKFLEYEEKEVALQQHPKDKFLNEFGVNGNIKDKPDLNMKQNVPVKVLVKLDNVSARWGAPIQQTDPNKPVRADKAPEVEIYEPLTLNGVNIDFKKGSLIGVVGSVGAGKSSMLQVILEELPIESGSLVVQGKVSYACQEPWVFAATVRQNILFGQEYEKFRYDSVVKSCALLKDFEQLENGDKTIIGEKGASLSGGQKARISLARAVYREADIYLLDDPLSAVDAHVGRHLFDEVIGPSGRLARRHTTRILVTHQVHFLKEADWVVVLNDGKVEIQGNPNDLSKSGIDFAELLENEVTEEEEVESLLGKRSGRSSTRSLSSSRNTIGSESDDGMDEKEAVDDAHRMEASSKGAVKGSVILNYFRSSGSLFMALIIFLLFILTQFAASFADYWVSYWTSQEELRSYYEKQNITADTVYNALAGDIENSTFLNSDLTTEYNNEFLNATQYNEESIVPELLSTETCLIIYGSTVIAIFLIGITRSIGFFTMAIKASQKMHDGMFKGIIQAPMRFFDTNPSGRILNRFSKDMGAVDELLPKAMLDATQIILSMFGAIIVTSVVKPIFLVPVFLLGILFLIIRKIYLRTSKNIKRLEGITRSPVFTHLSATLGGLSTIRAFGAQGELIKEFDAHQDIHTGAWYMFIGTSTAFGLSLDIICLVFLACVTYYFLLLDTSATGDQVGLAITQTVALTGLLQWGIRQSAEVANQLMSVERVLEYRDLDKEKEPTKPGPVSKEWPQHGKVEFRNVVYRYYAEAEPVLKGLSFVINPKEKIGIVGRTGAGKSSLIGALFRLAQVEGEIILDGINTATLTIQNLRSKISIIPQDPVLFSGTLRRNLDPFEEYPDAELWNSLEAVELKELANGPHGLQAVVAAGGSNFSVGQRQLVCLARAILRNNKVLVLDEATANVDPHTDSLIQKTIRERFNDCTVLTIAHRLHTIMDSDRVLVMNVGVVEEFDTAYALLQKFGGLFKDMVQSTGPQEAERLHHMATEKHESLMKES